MRRREFIAALGSAPAWPVVAGAQQPAVPVDWFPQQLVSSRFDLRHAGILRRPQSKGYIEGRDIKIEYRWADGHYERLPGLASDLAKPKRPPGSAGVAVAV